MKLFSRSGRRLAFTSMLAVLLGAVFTLSNASSFAQQLTGTISGTVYDQSGAVVPNAKVVFKNEASGDQRTTVTETDGHFVITAVQPASYSIEISAKGFSSWAENGIVMNVGDNRDVPNIKLNVGGNSTQVNVVAGADAVVPTDTAEISTSINQQEINDFPLQGRDAGELLKIVPGLGLNTGASNTGGFNDKVVGTNNGPVGGYSANGTQPNGALAYMLDGANLVDPGNAGTQIANINPDMVSSIKVLLSTYGAEYAKGPVIFQAFSRSGGSQFHGEGYYYTHNQTLNATDAFTNSQGPTAIALATQSATYQYIGGNIGGPIIFPHFGYNKNRNRLFFWTGYEYQKQQPAGTPVDYNTPTPGQLAGNFPTYANNDPRLTTWPNFYGNLTQNLPPGGTANSIPTSSYDPNIAGVLKLYPTPNVTPTSSNGYTNYTYVPALPQNRWELTGKVDYAISDNDKITGSYTYQREHDLAPISVWWSAPWTLPYPSAAASTTNAYVILTNYTHVFSPTTTNEFVFTWSHFVNPYALANPKAVDRTANGFNVNGLFGHTTSQLPAFEGPWGGTVANLGASYSFSSGTFGATKQVPAFYDTATKIVGAHTVKAGFYWDVSENTQNNTYPDIGIFNNEGSQFSTNNYVADLELGNISNYQQQNTAPIVGLKYHQWSIWGQDSWKAAKNLTVNIGLRLDHVGAWYGTPNGIQVWNPASYVNAIPTVAPNNTGLLWSGIDHSIPNSGFPSKLFHPAPRLGIAYDIFGTGKTVFRGGYGTYFYQTAVNSAQLAAGGPLGTFEYTTPTAIQGPAYPINAAVAQGGYAGIAAFTPPSSVAQNGSSVDANAQGDEAIPFTTNYNATISQALPWRSVMEASYVGNRSAHEFVNGGNSNLNNLNNIPFGGLFGADPLTGQVLSPASPQCSTPGPNYNPANDSLYCAANRATYSTTQNANDYRPLLAYQNVYYLTHPSYARYNSFQLTWQKQSGPVTFITNYTFSKVLGVRDGDTSNGNGNGTGIDPFSLKGNYAPLAYDHTHILNFTYTWQLPSFVKTENSLGTKLAGGAINGWKVSGYTAFQSGAPLQPNEGGNLNATYAGGLTVPTVANPDLPDNSIKLPNGLVATSINTSTYFGSNAYNVLVPAVTCDPKAGLRKVETNAGKQGQRFNPACFTTPAVGQQGPTSLPYIRLPNYWDSDLGIYKSFRVTESQRFEIRASATNWLNHPLGQFALAGNSDISLNFQQKTAATCTGCAGLSVTSVAPTNQNTLTTGAPNFKTGSRFVTLAAKYYF